jgi:hypothetical protein
MAIDETGDSVPAVADETGGAATPPQASNAETTPESSASPLAAESPAFLAAVEAKAREMQSGSDMQRAAALKETHRVNQLLNAANARNQTLMASATTHLESAGYEGTEQWQQNLQLEEEAAYGRAIKEDIAQQQKDQHQAQIITSAWGIDPMDTRLEGAANWADFEQKVQTIYSEDVAKKRDSEVAVQKQTEQDALQKTVDAGETDMMAASPAGESSLESEYKNKVSKLQGQPDAIFQLQLEYRGKGLTI